MTKDNNSKQVSEEVQNLKDNIQRAFDKEVEATVEEREDSNLIDIEVEFEDSVLMLPSRAFDQSKFDINGIVVQEGSIQVSVVRCFR